VDIIELPLTERANNFLDKRANSELLLTYYFHDQNNEDFHVRDTPKLMAITYEGKEYGHELFIDFGNCSFSFCEKDYLFYFDETKNYITLGSKNHDNHYVVIEFLEKVS